jgi:hypothetical protein
VKKGMVFLAVVVCLVGAIPAYASGRVSSEVKENIAYVHHDSAWFNCCPEMVFEIKKDGYTIDIYEEDLDIHPCDCMCDFDFTHKLEGLKPGTYLAQVWENNHYDTKGFRLAGETSFIIPAKVGLYRTSSARSECGGWPAAEEDHSSPEGLRISTPSLTHSPVKISYVLPEAASVTIAVYDVIGIKLLTLNLGFREAGEHSVVWDACSEAGQPVPRGIYFVRLQASGSSRSLRLIVLR